MDIAKAILIFFLLISTIEKMESLVDKKEKRDVKIEGLYLIEVILGIIGTVWMFNI